MSVSYKLSNILFLDIECVPQAASFFDLDDDLKMLWEKKGLRLLQSASIDDETSMDDLYDNRSGIFAEFGKIIVISVGYFAKTSDGKQEFRLKSFYGDDERTLLLNFFDLLNNHYSKSFHQLCGHNVKEFDVPYICRRATVHGLELPNILDLHGKKPWEVNHIDTLELRKFGDRKNFISLDLLCRVLNIQTPKTDISGEQVARVYRDEKNLQRIKEYCERDVVAVAEVLLKFMRRENPVDEVVFSE